jgi:hypothetical protein
MSGWGSRGAPRRMLALVLTAALPACIAAAASAQASAAVRTVGNVVAIPAWGYPPAVPDATRIAGATRVETAIAIAQDEFPSPASAHAVVLARGDAFPDALAGGPLAAKVAGPLLLISRSGVDALVRTEILRVLPAGSTVYIMGGSAALPASVDVTLTSLGYVAKRLAGADRFATAVAAANQMGNPTTVFEADGLDYADALVAGPPAIKSGGVILLTSASHQSPPTAAYLAAHSGGKHYAIGGSAVAADSSAIAVAGADRFFTSGMVATTFFSDAVVDGVATGLDFPDALAAGPLLAARNAPLLLVAGTGGPLRPGITVAMLGQSMLTGAVIFGGTRAFADDVANEISVLAGAAPRAAAADVSGIFGGPFGYLTEQVSVNGVVLNETDIVDASSGDATVCRQGTPARLVAGAYPTRAQLAALPLSSELLKPALNALYASYDALQGFGFAAVDDLFAVNAEQLVLDPLALPSLRYAVYTTLALHDAVTTGQAGMIGDSLHIAALIAPGSSDGMEIDYWVDLRMQKPALNSVLRGRGSRVTTVIGLATFGNNAGCG